MQTRSCDVFRSEVALGRAALVAVIAAVVSMVPDSSARAQNGNGTPPAIDTSAVNTLRDPLPSWNDGDAKRAIFEFVSRVTRQGADYRPPAERIAIFDNDGTLWQEQPTVEAMFSIGRVARLAERDPTLRQRQPFKAALERDMAYLHGAGEKAALELLMASHANMAQEEFAREARAFLDTARHPTLDRRYTELAYRPMLELLEYLRSHQFRIWISSGGTVDFIRVFADEVYGIPPERVIGSALKREARLHGRKLLVWRLPLLESINDQDAKAVNIDRIIGLRPILVAGNVRSGGDIGMMQYSNGRAGASLQILIDHDDDAREFAYQERDTVSLKAARAYGYTVVSMRRDWRSVFGPAASVRPATPR
jgi:phosphoglycolate phosphatase-like HAD superfamily hydrolase